MSRNGSHERGPVWFAWDPFQWQIETAHLNPAAEAAARRIVDHTFRTNQSSFQLVDNDEYLASLTKLTAAEWAQARKQLIDGPQPLFRKTHGGHLVHERLTAEFERAVRLTATNRRNGAGRRRSGGLADDEQLFEDRTATEEPSLSDRQSRGAPLRNAGDANDEQALHVHEQTKKLDRPTGLRTQTDIMTIDTTETGGVDENEIQFVQSVAAAVLPRAIVPSLSEVARWMTVLGQDGAQVSAALCDAAPNVLKGRRPAYVLKTLKRMFDEGFHAEDARTYVDIVLAATKSRRFLPCASAVEDDGVQPS